MAHQSAHIPALALASILLVLGLSRTTAILTPSLYTDSNPAAGVCDLVIAALLAVPRTRVVGAAAALALNLIGVGAALGWLARIEVESRVSLGSLVGMCAAAVAVGWMARAAKSPKSDERSKGR